jgi:hypothetical protein
MFRIWYFLLDFCVLTYFLDKISVVYLQIVKTLSRILSFTVLIYVAFHFFSCKKDKYVKDPGAKLNFSQDSVLFDTVFTKIGSSTRNFRIRNKNNQKILISSIQLAGGSSSPFIVNVDGSQGKSFTDIEIAANDSMYVFVQVNVNPTNINSPLIITDEINFVVNGNEQKVILEAWGQDAYYHYPTNAIKFKDGSYLPYSLISSTEGVDTTWKKDKPHVIYGYLVVDSLQKLTIQAGVRIYLNYKAGLWVYKGGELQVLGQKGNEVIFQGARREKDYADEPGQWDRIWINEGSKNNIIDYAIIKNGYIGIQTELFGNVLDSSQLTLTNTRIQNMSMWGLYSLFYRIYAGNNVISNCQEHSVNVLLGGAYEFVHCTFANYWNKDKPRDKATVNVNNHSSVQTLPIYINFKNCIIDGKLDNEINLDIKEDTTFPPTYTFSNCWIKTNSDLSNATHFINNKAGSKDDVLDYKDVPAYNFEPKPGETRIKNFVHPLASSAAAAFPKDIVGQTRNTTSVTAGAYQN